MNTLLHCYTDGTIYNAILFVQKQLPVTTGAVVISCKKRIVRDVIRTLIRFNVSIMNNISLKTIHFP